MDGKTWAVWLAPAILVAGASVASAQGIPIRPQDLERPELKPEEDVWPRAYRQPASSDSAAPTIPSRLPDCLPLGPPSPSGPPAPPALRCDTPPSPPSPQPTPSTQPQPQPAEPPPSGTLGLRSVLDSAVRHAPLVCGTGTLSCGLTSAAPVSNPELDRVRLDAYRAAGRAYWAWVAAGQEVLIEGDLLDAARTRDKVLKEQVKVRKRSDSLITENARIVVEREARLLVAEHRYREAAIALSQYLRDDQGKPRLPEPTELPRFPEVSGLPSKERRQRDLDEALRVRPELTALRTERLRGEATQLVSRRAGLLGQRLEYVADPTAQVSLARIEARQRHQRERIVAEMLSCLADLECAHALRQKVRERVQLAKSLEEEAAEQFEEGDGDLERLNRRECESAEAQLQEVTALARYHRALADYSAVLGPAE